MIVRLAAACAVLALTACPGGSRTSRPPQPVELDGGATVGGPGTICALGEHHIGGGEAHACAAGLQCCYPCGIEGCDSVCMADCGPPRP